MTASPEYLLLLALVLFVSSIGAGTLAGLFGVGGGVIIVPVLYQVFAAFGVDEALRMHLAVGTSLASIMPTSLRSVSAHNKKGAVDWDVLRHWAPATAIGVLMGGALAAWLSGDALSLVFGVLALAVALYLGLGREEWRLGNELPKGVGAYLAAGAIGLASALMGIGGGTFAVALMTLFATPIHRAVATASGLGFVIAVPGAIAFAIAGWNEPGLPPLSLGYVNLLGLALVALGTTLAAPWGVALAHRASRIVLRRRFAAFLGLMGTRMLWVALT